MKEIKVVIGKNFGDEGKGKCVDFLCNMAVKEGKWPLVVRHNGGAQAGHTVEEGDFRFVFHQLGSGSRRGAPVYWSSTYLPDLLKLGEEAEAFLETQKKTEIQIYANPNCICTTVYDVLLNSFAESLRSGENHGSCGMGIYETVRRTERVKAGEVGDHYAFCLGDLSGKSPAGFAELLKKIRDGYVPERINEIAGGQDVSKDNEWLSLMYDDNLLWNTAEIMWENYNRRIVLTDAAPLFSGFDTIIFENAQGLMLDRDNTPYFPHLTPSHTGVWNVCQILKEAGIKLASVDLHFVTRSYVTRHGKGRLDYECGRDAINPDMVDLTNVPNRWQGCLRYAKHPAAEDFFGPVEREAAEFLAYWKREAKGAESSLTVRSFIDVTHLDETGSKLLFCDGSVEIGEFSDCCKMRGLHMTVL